MLGKRGDCRTPSRGRLRNLLKICVFLSRGAGPPVASQVCVLWSGLFQGSGSTEYRVRNRSHSGPLSSQWPQPSPLAQDGGTQSFAALLDANTAPSDPAAQPASPPQAPGPAWSSAPSSPQSVANADPDCRSNSANSTATGAGTGVHQAAASAGNGATVGARSATGSGSNSDATTTTGSNATPAATQCGATTAEIARGSMPRDRSAFRPDALWRAKSASNSATNWSTRGAASVSASTVGSTSSGETTSGAPASPLSDQIATTTASGGPNSPDTQPIGVGTNNASAAAVNLPDPHSGRTERSDQPNDVDYPLVIRVPPVRRSTHLTRGFPAGNRNGARAGKIHQSIFALRQILSRHA